MADVNTTLRGSGFHADPKTGVCYRTLDFMGYPGYRVGDDGSVWTCKTFRGKIPDGPTVWRRMTVSPNKTGHQRVSLTHAEKRRCNYVHRLVLLAFVGPCPPGYEARHFPDRDTSNNRPSNLRWGTRSENACDRARDGSLNGEKNGRATTTAVVIRQLRTEYAAGGVTYAELARKHELPLTVVSQAVRRSTWKHLA